MLGSVGGGGRRPGDGLRHAALGRGEIRRRLGEFRRARRRQRRGVVDQRNVAHRRQRNGVRQQVRRCRRRGRRNGSGFRGRRNRNARSRVGLGREARDDRRRLCRRSGLSAPLGLDDDRAEKFGRVFVSRQRQGGRQAQARGLGEARLGRRVGDCRRCAGVDVHDVGGDAADRRGDDRAQNERTRASAGSAVFFQGNPANCCVCPLHALPTLNASLRWG